MTRSKIGNKGEGRGGGGGKGESLIKSARGKTPTAFEDQGCRGQPKQHQQRQCVHNIIIESLNERTHIQKYQGDVQPQDN